MEKFIPLDKQSKKQQREFYKSRRKDWGDISPVTRKSKNDYKKRKDNREEFQRYMKALWQRAQARKAFREDKKESGE